MLGEWFGSERGLGVLLLNAMRNFQVEQLWAVAIVLVLLAGGAYLLLGGVEKIVEEIFGRVVAVGGVRLGGDLGWVRSLASQLWVVALLAVGWWLWIDLESVPELVAPSPLKTLDAVVDTPGLYIEHTLATLVSAIGGLSMGPWRWERHSHSSVPSRWRCAIRCPRSW